MVAAGDNTYMYSDDRSKTGDFLENLARTDPQNRFIHGPESIKDQGKIKESEFAKHVGLTQPTLHRILTGKSKDPTPTTIRKIAKATTMASSWEELPEPAQMFVAELIGNVIQFQRENPAIAEVIFTTPDPKRHEAAMKQIEHWQATHRKTPAKE